MNYNNKKVELNLLSYPTTNKKKIPSYIIINLKITNKIN